jgi:periplasmic glucans biosynthesis protein
VAYWIERPGPGKRNFTIYALLDSPSATGAYKFTVHPGQTLEMDIEAEIHARRDLTHIGIAPLTSMFLFDETNRSRFDDFRPAVYDNDGLLIWNGAGEVLWRALANPLALQVSSFGDTNPKGFGLMQRARKFDDFADMVARYDRRPSAWVEPGEGWGDGAITLVELPTLKEINDNIVVYWRPKDVFKAGSTRKVTYRLSWGGEPDLPGGLAKATNTRIGAAYEHGLIATIDFAAIEALPADVTTLTAVATNSAGKMLSKPLIQINPETGGPRVAFTFDPGKEPVIEFRVQLLTPAGAYSEVWLYRWTA